MRRLIFLFLLIYGCTKSHPDSLYFTDNYKQVFNYASRDNKDVIIDFYTNWCGGCRVYDKQTFVDSTFKNYVLKNFYSTKINAELFQSKEITNKYRIKAYPTIIIAKSNGEEIDRIIGFKGDDIKKFILLIENCVKGKEKLRYLDSLYSLNPDDKVLMEKIALEKLYGVNDFKNLMRFSENVLKKSTKPDIKNEAKLFYAIGAIQDISNPRPQPIKDLLNSNVLSDDIYREECNKQLMRYYENMEMNDSIDYYNKILLNIESPGGHFVYVRNYAKLLYENNRNIELANQLTKEYTTHPGNESDHWTPFLLAHMAANHKEVSKGNDIFDQWMNKYSPNNKEDKSIWPYEFYISYALFYRTRLDKALEYSRILENLNASKDYKKMAAKLLYLNNQQEKSIQKLNEVLKMVGTQKEKSEIEELINNYQKTTDPINRKIN
jgi:thiol-disulfide isomerase/thioredoxin